LDHRFGGENPSREASQVRFMVDGERIAVGTPSSTSEAKSLMKQLILSSKIMGKRSLSLHSTGSYHHCPYFWAMNLGGTRSIFSGQFFHWI